MVVESDADAYGRALDGDRDAVEEVVRRHSEMVWRAIRAYRIDEASARDVHQTVWLKWFEHLDRARGDPSRALRNPDSLRFWLLSVARNECMSVFRHRKRAIPTEIDENLVVYLPDTDERLEGEENRRAMWHAFEKLDDDCRELLTYLMVDPPLSYQEISELVGRPVGSLGPTRGRCIERMRGLMT